MGVDNHRYAILDVSNLAYGHFFVIPPAVWIKDPAALVTGMAKTCRKLEEDLAVDTLVFAFDGGSEFRKELYPEYKATRKAARDNEDPLVQEARQAFFDQLRAFRTVHLPDIGAANIFHKVGVEADDIMAACVKSMPDARKVYLVTSDEDLFQCIEGNRVVLYKPVSKKVVNETDFRAAHNDLHPSLYASAKAWAGCSSDNIEGLPGIGIKKAAAFVMGKSKNKEIFFDNISVFNRNIKLTRLPAPGTPTCVPKHQEVPLDWDGLLARLQSLRPIRGVKQ